jgi:sterol desaturase/sphingolipid hydroxylase (fatty acid hydroxylase superfamily)
MTDSPHPLLQAVGHWLISGPMGHFVAFFFVAGVLAAAVRAPFRARKIQPDGFKWRVLHNEFLFGLLNVTTAALVLGSLSAYLTRVGLISFHSESTSGWIVALEYAVYFFAFDAYFYWMHRFMHIEPIYTWVHKIHHYSTSPNLTTTLSVGPLESIINGGFVPLFTMLLTIHQSTMALIIPTNIVMGLYVHCGYEFLPRWWNRSWVTRWFITATFHDQHHKYFRWNFGGYTTIWDFLCGTVRPKYLADFDQIKARLKPRERTGMALSQDRGGDETCSQSNITLLWRRG